MKTLPTKWLCCAILLGFSGVSVLSASDVGMDVPAAVFDFESSLDDNTIIRDMGSKVGYIREGDNSFEYWGYENFDLSGNPTHLTVRASSGGSGGRLYVRFANHYNDMLTLATIDIPNTGGWNAFEDFTVEIDPTVIALVGSVRNLFFVIESEGNPWYQFDVESFRFEDRTRLLLEAESYDLESYPSDDLIVRDMGDRVGYITNFQYIRFLSVDFGEEKSSVTVRASSRNQGGFLYITAGAPFDFGGDLIGVVEITSTGGWDQFEEFTFPLVTPISGVVNNLYLSFEGQGDYLYDLDWLRFDAE